MKSYTLAVWRYYQIEVEDDDEAVRVGRAVSAALAAGANESKWIVLELDTDVRRGRQGKVLWEENKTQEKTA